MMEMSVVHVQHPVIHIALYWVEQLLLCHNNKNEHDIWFSLTENEVVCCSQSSGTLSWKKTQKWRQCFAAWLLLMVFLALVVAQRTGDKCENPPAPDEGLPRFAADLLLVLQSDVWNWGLSLEKQASCLEVEWSSCQWNWCFLAKTI